MALSTTYLYYGKPIARGLQIWLMVGLVMVFVQVFVGGITRLTGSGLSITEWDIVTGTLPPLDAVGWGEEFEKYKQTPQYQKINVGMSLPEFQFIYFWEYFHRLWARSMGLVFAVPFVVFWVRRQIPKSLMMRLLAIIFLAAVVASFGWIMVASGLVDRPWVSAYKLTLHLSLALLLYGVLLWTFLTTAQQDKAKISSATKLKHHALWITAVAVVQIMLGGLMSGMHAGLLYPTFPDMNGELLPAKVFDPALYQWAQFKNYDSSDFVPTLVQVFHRATAYLLSAIVIAFFVRVRRRRHLVSKPLLLANYALLAALVVQFTLGVLTILNCVGKIPVGWGVLHQSGAVILLTAALVVNFQLSYPQPLAKSE